ncbi:helix-turn-helix transcriptional regulator [Limosilactobacillus reuteri]|nr:AraC family transcriptional regulator [Limosilactobacillus reuteri]MCC4443310.1 AraC family transcriptional regulator [Limosilactobacillus reuteri]
MAKKEIIKKNNKNKEKTGVNIYELLIGIEGEVQLITNQSYYSLQKGSSILLPPNTDLELKTLNEDSTYYCFQFFPKDEQKFFPYKQVVDCFNSREKLKRIINNVIIPTQYQINNFRKINTLALEIIRQIDQTYYTDAIPSYAVTSLLLQLTNDFVSGFFQGTIKDKRINEITKWIEENLSYKLTVQDVAEHFQLNYRYISKLLKQATGMSTSAYITHIKLELARQYLLESNLPLKLIADKSFFLDDKYFLKVFKKYVGETPTQYRQRYMKEFLVTDSQNRTKNHKK